MPLVGFEPTISLFELAKTVHALDLTATLIGTVQRLLRFNSRQNIFLNKALRSTKWH
jgi:hypothetical protein